MDKDMEALFAGVKEPKRYNLFYIIIWCFGFVFFEKIMLYIDRFQAPNKFFFEAYDICMIVISTVSIIAGSIGSAIVLFLVLEIFNRRRDRRYYSDALGIIGHLLINFEIPLMNIEGLEKMKDEFDTIGKTSTETLEVFRGIVAEVGYARVQELVENGLEKVNVFLDSSELCEKWIEASEEIKNYDYHNNYHLYKSLLNNDFSQLDHAAKMINDEVEQKRIYGEVDRVDFKKTYARYYLMIYLAFANEYELIEDTLKILNDVTISNWKAPFRLLKAIRAIGIQE